ncbi:WEB family protein [Tasmannia lanceolata]|uniref:WEB family protein n=1 Tax=Tasmannia lanceolata TaxID=3420 RepID=UPI004063935C
MAGDIDRRKSTSGYMFTFAGGAISWQSKLRKCVALSTKEAEYIAATEACKEMLWLKCFLIELGLDQKAYIVRCDSQSTIDLSKNATYHSRTKHIDVQYHWIRDVLEHGLMGITKSHTDRNPSDIMTKTVLMEKHELCRALTGMDATLSTSSYSSSLSHLKQEREDELTLANSLKKLETELEETKRELKLLKERESETEIAVASLNAELHKNMSKMAKAEAVAAANAAAKSSSLLLIEGGHQEVRGEEKTRDMGMKFEHSQCLAHVLSLREKEGYYGEAKKQKKTVKKKPIIPLIGDMFSKKKASINLHNPLYTNPEAYLS